MLSPGKTPRRVLGELTPNTKLAQSQIPQGAKSPAKTLPAASPLKAQPSFQASTTTTPDDENVSSTLLKASTKRPHSAIESPEKLDATRSPHKRQDMRVKTVSPAALKTNSTRPTVLIDVSDDETSAEEDNGAQVPREADGNHLEPQCGTQGTTRSFSSLINYNPETASDGSESVAASSPPPPQRSIPVTSHVELLKLRLRMAMYKINTNQTFTPFSQLEPPRVQLDSIKQDDMEDKEDDGEDEDEASQAVHEQEWKKYMENDKDDASGNIVIKGGPVGKLLGGPVFAPTAFSARFVQGPLSTADSPAKLMTPLASPAKRHLAEDRELTSSAVKGHAATGLLELAHSS